MKNIHVIPTENESKIRYNSFNKVYELCKFPKYHTDIKSTHNIYITSDEEIKGLDWFMDISDNSIWKNEHSRKMVKSIFPECKKIILTTDIELQKDGIQAIDDEFLEWYCRNSSREYINFISYVNEKSTKDYEIIIPKEELLDSNPQDNKQARLVKELANSLSSKQETLEEASENAYRFEADPNFPCDTEREDFLRIFNKGAKWQQHRMYSEEEVLELLRERTVHCKTETMFNYINTKKMV